MREDNEDYEYLVSESMGPPPGCGCSLGEKTNVFEVKSWASPAWSVGPGLQLILILILSPVGIGVRTSPQ